MSKHAKTKALIINPVWDTRGNGTGCRSNTRWPHIRKDKYLLFPIYLAYAAAVLEREGVRVKVVDAVAEELGLRQLVKQAKAEAPEYCFIESSTPTIDQDLKSSMSIKEATGSRVFLIGAHPTVFHRELMKENPWLDGVVRGEFELTMRDIVCGLEYPLIAGLTYRDGTEVNANPDRSPIENLDDMPFPAWHQFVLKKYESHLYVRPSAMVIPTRGCPFQCTYCLWPQVLYGHRQRRRSPGNVCDEIEMLIGLYGVKHIRFDDDTFALNKQYVIGCCDEMIKRGLHRKITWNCFGHITQPDHEMYERMSEAGCTKIAVGVESGSERILKVINKPIDLEKARQVVRSCRRAGIEIYCDFMIGFPYETEQDIRKSMDLAIELDPDYIQVSYAVPYPGTKMHSDGVREKFLKYPADWERYSSCETMIDTGTIDAKRLEQMYVEFWRRFYLRPAFIMRNAKKALSSADNMKKVSRGAVSFFNRFMRRQ
ncbi:MAG TPA: hypothetical protein DDW94_10665 [Deltaproteobacteria bacterium]|nr:MAG: hypothetical protein A2Z79_11710 [Deltaproteobacteria bacterium GWA2_55_82]OGQ63533.1 MAG: hypothetical protein A3I81_05900 [Deltaproteobacteria bacterium RIFCSPLOWO2_02_FULL_55_12]OIJ74915.1 MAG: hypothetical protein A2V21_311955 [Deltaproteobacteria bacterium GWC2_55_46]HBG47431.1 hypothetical protein [Deltaproteobacteria bacterium]HCY11447.1 hypothetical protein [Deltaproteobacteria bacterium]